jgi:hypothetical protein
MRESFTATGLMVYIFFLLPAVTRADGGTIRLSERHGPFQVTIFTSPTPLRAGPVDVSVLVMDLASGRPIQDAEVTVRAMHLASRGESIVISATSGAATNKLLRAAVFELPAAGTWRIEVDVQSQLGPARVHFEVDVAEPPPRWVSLWPWITWPGLVMVFFGVHQWLVRRRLH